MLSIQYEDLIGSMRAVLTFMHKNDSTGGSRQETPQKKIDQWIQDVKKLV